MKTTSAAKTTFSKNVMTTNSSIYEIALKSLDGSLIDLSSFKGKHLLFVNVASECGFTSQYKDIQKLSDTYTDELVVIGSPCNQFGKQEPGNASQIQSFCERNFGVTFILTEKIDVKGSKQHPLYKWLTSKDLNGRKNSSVRWNFQKYLVDKEGKLIDYYFSITKPMSSKITKYL
ncbi:glutathione peroxidase [Maribacter halichondriae]|uniref:glutathione peroxidase n=1 Tax=Maribacter halichondriae TaxID=2980554 RepID=UPI002359B29B|nr:glutathione peroxidase [Maribacter sp. Hal144]